MITPSLSVPLAVAAKTREGLSKAILKIQAQQGGRVNIITIYYDTEAGEHVAWYYAINMVPLSGTQNLGGA